jgi:hypothetical protein
MHAIGEMGKGSTFKSGENWRAASFRVEELLKCKVECDAAASAGEVDRHWTLLKTAVQGAGSKVFSKGPSLQSVPLEELTGSRKQNALRAQLRKRIVCYFAPGHCRCAREKHNESCACDVSASVAILFDVPENRQGHSNQCTATSKATGPRARRSTRTGL